MSVRPRGGRYQVDFMVDGKRIRETFDTEAAAIRWEASARADLLEGKPLPPVGNGRARGGAAIETLGQLLDYADKHHWAKLPRSYRGSLVNIGECRRYIGENVPVNKITRATMDAFIDVLHEKGNTNNTINRKLAIMSKALGIAGDIGLDVKNFNMPFLKPGAGRVRVIERQEEKRILNYFHNDGNEDMLDFTIAGIETGLRLSEMLRMEWTSVADDLSTWRVEFGKTKAARRSVPLNRHARGSLVRVRNRHTDGLGPFVHMAVRSKQHGVDLGTPYRDLWDRMRNDLKLDDVVIHTMRHTCATRLLQSGVTPFVVTKWMGWESEAMVKRYGHADDEDLMRALDKLEAGPALRVIEGGR